MGKRQELIPLKITLVLGYLAKGGTERQVAQLSSGFVQRGHDVQIFLLGRQLEDDYPVAAGVRVQALQITKFRHCIAGWRALCAGLRSSDLIYSFLDLANALCALAKPVDGARLVWGLRAANTSPNRLSRFGLWLSRRLCGKADALIANSQAVRGYYESQGFKCTNFWVIPNGVNTPGPEMISKQRDVNARMQYRAELDLPEDAFVALVLARVAPEKRQALGLHLLQRNPVLQVVFAGDGVEHLAKCWCEQGLADAELLSRCRFVTHQQDVAPLFGAADALLSLSSAEGFPNSVLEAMAHQVPVVATSVGGVTELLSSGSETLGWLVSNGSVNEVVAGLDEASQLVQAGGFEVEQRVQLAYLQVKQRYSVDFMVASTLDHLADLVDE